MKRLLKFILVSVLTLSMFGLTSCDLTGKEKRKQEAKDMALRLLEEKYGEEFEISDAYYDSGLIAYFSPVEHPEVIFEATISLTDEMLYGDSYPKDIIATRIQQECEKVLNELGIDYYVRPYIFSYKINETTCPYTDITSREYIDALHNEDINILIDEMDVMFDIYTSNSTLSYSENQLYETMHTIANSIDFNEGSISYIFTSDDELIKVKEHYTKFSLSSSGTVINDNHKRDHAFVVVSDFGVLRETQEEFKEMINRVKEYHGVK